jgi:hypothetical protein
VVCAAAAEAGQQEGLRPFERLTKASVEGLRYRAEDVARSLTKSAIKEVGGCGICVPALTRDGSRAESASGGSSQMPLTVLFCLPGGCYECKL